MKTAQLVASLATMATSNLSQGETASYSLASIQLWNGEAASVAVSDGQVTWLNSRTNRLEIFRSQAEAQLEISLERARLRCTYVHHEYCQQRVTIFGSVFSQAPESVREQYEFRDGYLFGDWICYFQLDGAWYSAKSMEECKAIFKVAIDAENNNNEGEF
jgi:hypothetical protein